MARDKSKPDRPLEEGEMLSKDENHIIGAAFAAHIGKGFTAEQSDKGRRSRKPLSDELDEILFEHPELKRLLAIKLVKTALLGRGKEAIAATKLIFDRTEGPVLPPPMKAQQEGVEVFLQELPRPAPPREVEARAVMERVSEMALPTTAEERAETNDARLALRREKRKLPTAEEILNAAEQEYRDGREE